jgi:hypothetical protein
VITLSPVICRVVLLAAGAGLALAACSQVEQAGTLPPPPALSAAPSPARAKSTAPASDKATILALAKDYYTERSRALESGDTARLTSLSTADCPCLAYARAVEAAWAKGSVRAHEFYLVIRGVPVLRSPTQGFVSIVYRTNGYTLLDNSGRPTKNYAADPKRESSLVSLQRRRGRWRVADVART